MDHVLYFRASPGFDPAAETALAAAAKRISPGRAAKIRVAFESSAARALMKLRGGGVDLLVVDARGEGKDLGGSAALSILRSLFGEHDLARVLGRERALLVVGDDGGHDAELAFEAGRLHLGGVIAAEPNRWEAIWEKIVATLARGRGGKVAICLAGGGTEGLLWELGVLRALDGFLGSASDGGRRMSLCDVDLICGISAGAILGGFLANGLRPDEIFEGLSRGHARLSPLPRRQLFDPSIGDLARRAARLSWEVARGKRAPLSALFRLPPPGIFAGDGLRRWLAGELRRPGMTDDFAKLQHKLFIGATDQDTSEHVVFGTQGAPNIPIHRAIRASTALAPFYAPEVIDGRYFVDGGFTRTTNMRVAVQEGATLVILIDPLVPISSMRRGHVAERGAIYGAMQGLKSLIHGRFDKAVPTLRAMYPHVAFHLFQPGEEARRVMAGSPMKYFYRTEIAEIAFRETAHQIRASRFEQLARDFERHEIAFRDPEAVRQPFESEPGEIRVVA